MAARESARPTSTLQLVLAKRGMAPLDTSAPAALAAVPDALPEDTWPEVTKDGGTLRVMRVPGGWHLNGDLSLSSAGVAEGGPTSVAALAPSPEDVARVRALGRDR